MTGPDYMEIEVSVPQEGLEMVMATLSFNGYDALLETPTGFHAFAEATTFDEQVLSELLAPFRTEFPLEYKVSRKKGENWNEVWEKQFEPILVGEECRVRASFHPFTPKVQYDIVIDPKMSFGTGHHATTYQMLDAQLRLDHRGKRVMDAGCGTAILAIMAEKRGASEVLAFDIDDWCIENSKENMALNGCQAIEIVKGSIGTVNPKSDYYDIVLANINRNILLQEFGMYREALVPEGLLLISGFMVSDYSHFRIAAKEFGFKVLSENARGEWAMMVLQVADASH